MFYTFNDNSGVIIPLYERVTIDGNLEEYFLEDLVTRTKALERAISQAQDIKIFLPNPTANPLPYFARGSVRDAALSNKMLDTFISLPVAYSLATSAQGRYVSAQEIKDLLAGINNNDYVIEFTSAVNAMTLLIVKMKELGNLSPENMETIENISPKEFYKSQEIELTELENLFITTVIKAYFDYLSWQNTKIDNILIADVMYMDNTTSTILLQRNAKMSSLKYLNNNRTLDSSRSEDDEVYCELPKYQELCAAYTTGAISSLDEFDGEVNNDDDEDSQSSYEKTYKGASDPYALPTMNMIAPKYMTLPAFQLLWDYSSYKEASSGAGVAISDIEGHTEVNNLDIQPNEKRYYDSLCELYDYAEKQSLNTDNGVNQDRLDAVISYFKELCQYLVALGRSHTGLVYMKSNRIIRSLGLSDVKANDIEGDEGVTATVGVVKARTRMNNKKSSVFYINNNLETFLDQAYEVNKYAYCEAIIKLMRWGRRKPSRLKISDYDVYLDLNNGRLYDNSGSYGDLKLISEGSKIYTVVGIITTNEKLIDLEYAKSLDESNIFDCTLGFLCEQRYESGEVLKVAFSCADIVNILNEGDNKFFNIVLNEDGSIRVTDEITESYLLEDIVKFIINNEVDYKIYKDSLLKEYMLENKADIGNTSYLALLYKALGMQNINNQFVNYSFKNTQELKEKMLETGKPLIDFVHINILKEFLPLILRINNEIYFNDDSSPSDILTLYNIEMIKSNFNAKLTNRESNIEVNKESAGAISNKLSKLAAFSSAPKQQEEMTKVDERLIHELSGSSFADFIAILDNGEHKDLVTPQGKHIGVLTGGKTLLGNLITVGNTRVFITSTPQKPIYGKKSLGVSSFDKFREVVEKNEKALKAGQITNMPFKFASAEAYEDFKFLCERLGK